MNVNSHWFPLSSPNEAAKVLLIITPANPKTIPNTYPTILFFLSDFLILSFISSKGTPDAPNIRRFRSILIYIYIYIIK